LPHDPPHFIGTSDAIFFITICCQPKGTNQLCFSEIAKILFDAARFYYERHYWGLPILLLMPDHLHMLASFGRTSG
jgi:putative transposase